MPAYDFNFVPQTELDAVNQMLMSIGQSPVNTLAVAGIKTVNMARLHLHNVSREVQSRGWEFNTDENFPLTKDVNGKIAVPTDSMSIDPVDTTLRFVERNDGGTRRLWDKVNHTFVIARDIKVDIIRFFQFEHMPQSARAYIAHKAARVFQASGIASDVLHRFTTEREIELAAEFEREERRSADSNMFAHDTIAGRIFNRHR